MKDFFQITDLDILFNKIIPRLNHGNDGIIFTKNDSPYDIYQSDHLLKWKPP